MKNKEKEITVSILTTPFRKSRYHFASDKQLEIVIERTAAYITNPKNSRVGLAAMDHVYTIRKYRIDLDELTTSATSDKYIIVHPAAKVVSKVSGSQIEIVYNDDVLLGDIRVVGLKGFLEKIS